MTAENLSLFSRQSAKPVAFQHPAKREKARKSRRAQKEGSRIRKARSLGKVSEPPKSAAARVKHGKVGELFDNTEFDILEALEKVDRYRSRGPEEDHIAHTHTLAMLDATPDMAKSDRLARDVPTQAPVDDGCQEGPYRVPCGPNEANVSGDLDTAGEPNTSGEAKKNLHQSFNTTTTESFGHIYHRNGCPVPPPPTGPSQRFPHRRQNSGEALANISEAAESKSEARDARSAMVEDVPDVS